MPEEQRMKEVTKAREQNRKRKGVVCQVFVRWMDVDGRAATPPLRSEAGWMHGDVPVQ